jgi:hypothetical protein
MRIYITQMSDCCGPVGWRTLEEAVAELRELAEEMSEGDTWTIGVKEMTDEEFSSLPDFTGY